MLPKLIIALAPVGIILVASEYLWRKKIVKGERARKFIHILAGIWMALWPLYLPFDGIFVLGCMALTLLLYSRVTRLFHAIYAVKRRTYGDILFAVAIVLCAYLARAPWIFTIAILLLAVADGGAAVVGRFWGIKNQYFVFGKKSLRKSVAGTLAFIALSYACITAGILVGGVAVNENNALLLFAILPAGATLLENIMPYGFDNLFTPLFATILLNSLL